jgi:hypothetical protein
LGSFGHLRLLARVDAKIVSGERVVSGLLEQDPVLKRAWEHLRAPAIQPNCAGKHVGGGRSLFSRLNFEFGVAPGEFAV